METKHQKYHRLHYDKRMISKWKSRGLLLREGETYELIFRKVNSASNCELCNVSFEGKKAEMDHDHISGYFRKVLCRSCNASYLQVRSMLILIIPKQKKKINRELVSPSKTKVSNVTPSLQGA